MWNIGIRLGFVAGFVLLLASCHASRVNDISLQAQADVIIYKTRMNHMNHVPITLNETRDRVTSFPAPGDLYFEGKLALPVPLEEDYLLDLRGISKHTVFTSYTYEEYSQMDKAPSVGELLSHVIDLHPFESIYYCGKAGDYADLVKELNKKILSGMEGFEPIHSTMTEK